MSQDDLQRGDPPPGPGYGPPPGYGSGYGPGYGPPPGYGPAYGPPPGYGGGYGPPPGYPAWRRPTNVMAILALVMAFAFAPAGLVLGIVARRQIRHTGEEGDGLALAGIIVGGIATAFFAMAIFFWFAALASISGGM